MATIIDALVVTLGLDSKQWTKGREQADKETETTRRKTKEAADDISKSLQDVGKTIAGLFLGFESATGFAKWLGGLNAGEAALGRTAANIGLNVHELNRWGNATALAGGEAQDAQAAFTQLTNEAEKFFVTGDASPLIGTLQQYGVALKDSKGQLRNQGEIFEELADKTAVYGRQYQNFVLKQAGITQGEINYLTLSKDKREELLRLAERQNGVTDETVRQAQELQLYWRNVGQEISKTGQAILTAITPAMEQVLSLFSDVDAKGEEVATGVKLIASAALVVKRIFAGLGNILGGTAAAVGALLHGDVREAGRIVKDVWTNNAEAGSATADKLVGVWEDKPASKAPTAANNAATTGGYVPPAGTKADRYNNPGNILDKSGNEIKYGSLAEGQAALEKDLAIKMRRGLRTVDSIVDAYEGHDGIRNNIPAYQADVKKKLGKNDLSESDIAALAYAISTHESGASRVSSGPTPGLSAAGGNKSGGVAGTTVTIDQMHVTSTQADPVKVAEAIPAAIERKMTVAQADTGQY